MKVKYAPLWILMGILWLCIQLPYAWQLNIGRFIGRLALRFARRERRIAKINLSRCFPHLTEKERNHLLHESFKAMGIGAMETAFAWWGSENRLKKLIHIEGLEHVKNALSACKGALIFTPHFSSIHIVGRGINLFQPFAVMSLPPKNPVLLDIRERAIHRIYQTVIPRDGARELLKALKQNMAVLYMPDIDAGKKGMFVPFFGIPASTVTATPRFAQISGCAVIPASYFRREDGTGYEIKFYPPLKNYPTDEPYKDAALINQWIEQFVREHPEQYLWQYKRFKTRPKGEEKFYT